MENVNLYHNFIQIVGYIPIYKCIFYKNMHKHSVAWKKIQIWVNFIFSKNVTPPSYRNEIQLLYDKYLQFGYFCFFIEHVFS